MTQNEGGRKRRRIAQKKRNKPTRAKMRKSAAADSLPQPLGIALRPFQPPEFTRIELRDHRALAVAFRTLGQRIAESPEYSVMLAINPVLALEQYGISLTPELRDHVLRTLQHSGPVRERRDALEESLTEAIGERPRPTDETWLAETVFKKLGVAALDTAGVEPTYKPPLNVEILKRIAPVRPPGTRRYPNARRSKVKSHLAMRPWREAVRRLDLDARPPKRPQAKSPPETFTLEQLWFYKDQNSTLHDLLELGVIQMSGMRVQSPDSFRRIAEGERRDAFRVWVRSIRFKDLDS
jgi:hypothetical protein